MAHEPTDNNGVPYAMNHEVRAEREAIIAYCNSQARSFDGAAKFHFETGQAIPAHNAQIIAQTYRGMADSMEKGWDIRERPSPLPVVASKGPLVWGKTGNGNPCLMLPNSTKGWLGAPYLAFSGSGGACAYVGDRAEMNREEIGANRAANVALIVAWATEDGYEVPPCPYNLED